MDSKKLLLLILPSIWISCHPKSGTNDTSAGVVASTSSEGMEKQTEPEPQMPAPTPHGTMQPRPFDPPRQDPLLPGSGVSPPPLPVELPAYIPFLISGGMNADQISAAIVANNPVVHQANEEVGQAIEERRRRVDEINENIESEFVDAWNEYQKKLSNNQPAVKPVRRGYKNSEIEHLIDADHLIAASKYSYSKVAADQVANSLSVYVDLISTRAVLRSLLAEEKFLLNLKSTVESLFSSGQIPYSELLEVESSLLATSAKINTSQAEQNARAADLFALLDIDPTNGADYFGDVQISDPSTINFPDGPGIIDGAIDISFLLRELTAKKEAALARMRKEQWLVVEGHHNLPHAEEQHSAAIEEAAAVIFALDVNAEAAQIGSAVNAGSVNLNSTITSYKALESKLSLSEKVFFDTRSKVLDGESTFQELTHAVGEVLETREQLDLASLEFFKGLESYNRLILNGRYVWLPLVWGDIP